MRMSTKWSWRKVVVKKMTLWMQIKSVLSLVSSTKGSVTLVRTDFESVHVHGAFVKYCHDRGIRVSSSSTRLKEMNGQAERDFGTIKNMTRMLLTMR